MVRLALALLSKMVYVRPTKVFHESVKACKTKSERTFKLKSEKEEEGEKKKKTFWEECTKMYVDQG